MENLSITEALEKVLDADAADQKQELLHHLDYQSSLSKEIDKKMGLLLKILINREKPFLDMDEAADYLKIKKNTLYQFTSKGILPYYKPCKKVYFSVDDLNQFILDRKNRYLSNAEIDEKVATKMVLNRKIN